MNLSRSRSRASLWFGPRPPRRCCSIAPADSRPTPLALLYSAVEDDEALGDRDAFDDVRALFVAKSLVLAEAAVAKGVLGKPFASMTIAKPLRIRATPGHDEPSVELLTVA